MQHPQLWDACYSIDCSHWQNFLLTCRLGFFLRSFHYFLSCPLVFWKISQTLLLYNSSSDTGKKLLYPLFLLFVRLNIRVSLGWAGIPNLFGSGTGSGFSGFRSGRGGHAQTKLCALVCCFASLVPNGPQPECGPWPGSWRPLLLGDEKEKGVFQKMTNEE